LLLDIEILWLEKNITDIISVTKFTHALTNDVFLVTNSEELQFIFKRLNRDARTDDDRQAELLVQRLANQYNLTPQVLAHNESYKLQEYIPGELLPKNSNNLFEFLATQLTRIHQLPALHAPKQRLGCELQRLKSQLMVNIDELHFQKMLDLAIQLDQSSSNDTLCHGDLSLNNVLQGTNKKIYILDWEYAVIACVAYDLAFCNCINGFSKNESTTLISHYYSLLPSPQKQSLESLQKKCHLYLIVFIYINELWSLCFVDKD
jgi:thiamine kinase-like enzyme